MAKFILFLSFILCLGCNFSAAQNDNSQEKKESVYENFYNFYCGFEDQDIVQIAYDLAQSKNAFNLALADALTRERRKFNPNLLDEQTAKNWRRQAIELAKQKPDSLTLEFLTMLYHYRNPQNEAQLWHEYEPQNLAPVFFLPKFENDNDLLSKAEQSTYFKSQFYAIQRKIFATLLSYENQYQTKKTSDELENSKCRANFAQTMTFEVTSISLDMAWWGHNETIFLKKCRQENADSRCAKIAQIMTEAQNVVTENIGLMVLSKFSNDADEIAHLKQRSKQIKEELNISSAFTSMSNGIERMTNFDIQIYQNPKINSEQEKIAFILAQKQKLEQTTK